MFCKKEFFQTVELSHKKDTTIKFSKTVKFICPKLDKNGDSWYQIKDVQGDFEITHFTRNYGESNITGDYDESSWKLKYYQGHTLKHTFYILANAKMEEMCVVDYQLCIPSSHLQCLKWGKFVKSDFVLPGYDDLKFTYYVRKIDGASLNDIEIIIKNPYPDVEIQGKQGDFKCEQTSSKNLELCLSFGFDPIKWIKISDDDNIDEDQASTSGSEIFVEQSGTIQVSAIDESRPETVIQNEVFATSIGTKLLHKIASNHLFSDVFFIASDGIKIPSHRCILAESSNILMQIFKESTVIPVIINVDDSDADTIESAFNYLYDITDSINGKELDVFKFAVKYGIQDLTEKCCTFFEESVDPTNVCEYIQIAYLNNFEELKRKCLMILVENKYEIDPEKKIALPKYILLDAYCL